MWRVLLCACLLLGPQAASAQDRVDVPAPSSPVLTLDEEQLFLETRFGKRVQAELEAARSELAAENRQIEADLIAEERQLTEQRAELPPEVFAPLAQAFDEKVQRIRHEREDRSVELQRRLEEERQEFLARVGPVLVELARSRNAAVILDRNAILMSLEGIDVTQDAIELLDARIGDGTEPADGAAEDGDN